MTICGFSIFGGNSNGYSFLYLSDLRPANQCVPNSASWDASSVPGGHDRDTLGVSETPDEMGNGTLGTLGTRFEGPVDDKQGSDRPSEAQEIPARVMANVRNFAEGRPDADRDLVKRAHAMFSPGVIDAAVDQLVASGDERFKHLDRAAK